MAQSQKHSGQKHSGQKHSDRQSDRESELWIKAHQGEALGHAYFSSLARHTANPEHRAKLEALAVLEDSTRKLLEPSMERIGVPTDGEPAPLDVTRDGGEADYPAVLEPIPRLAAEYLQYYVELRALVEERDAPTIDLLIAHELALEVFVRRELAGETEGSLEALRALSHVPL